MKKIYKFHVIRKGKKRQASMKLNSKDKLETVQVGLGDTELEAIADLLPKLKDYLPTELEYDDRELSEELLKIEAWLKSTEEPFENIFWDGKLLEIWNGTRVTETHRRIDLIRERVFHE